MSSNRIQQIALHYFQLKPIFRIAFLAIKSEVNCLSKSIIFDKLIEVGQCETMHLKQLNQAQRHLLESCHYVVSLHIIVGLVRLSNVALCNIEYSGRHVKVHSFLIDGVRIGLELFPIHVDNQQVFLVLCDFGSDEIVTGSF